MQVLYLIFPIDSSDDLSFSGGNLAAIVALKAPTLGLLGPILCRLLIVPFTDDTTSVSGGKHLGESPDTAWLPVEHMKWFHDHYLPHMEDRDSRRSLLPTSCY